MVGEKNGELAVKSQPSQLVISEEVVDNYMQTSQMLTSKFQQWLIKEVDFTTEIFGKGRKPTLLDPGAGKLIGFFQCRPRHRILERYYAKDEEGYESIRYAVATEVVQSSTGLVVAEGVGSCSSDEVKYKYRWYYTSELRRMGYTDEDIDKLPEKMRGKSPVYRARNPEIPDLDNTLFKMAAKRCLGSTTPILIKTGRSVVRNHLSHMYTIWLKSKAPIYVPGPSGGWRQVLNMTREEGRTVYNIRFADGSYLRPTEDHEFPTTEGSKLVKYLKVGDVLLREKISVENGNADVKYGWIVGLYLAEGGPLDGGDSMKFTLNAAEVEIADKIRSIAEPLGARVVPKIRKVSANTRDVHVYGKAFAGLIHQFINGKGAAGKRLSKFAWSQGEAFLAQVLEGYEAGDTYTTHRRKTPKIMLGFTGKNWNLANDIRCLCAILNLRVKIKLGTAKDNTGKKHSAYTGWITERVESYNQLNLEEITSIKKETKPAVVYDIDVDGDNLFLLANGIVSHNSEVDACLQLPGVAAVFTQDVGDYKKPEGQRKDVDVEQDPGKKKKPTKKKPADSDKVKKIREQARKDRETRLAEEKGDGELSPPEEPEPVEEEPVEPVEEVTPPSEEPEPEVPSAKPSEEEPPQGHPRSVAEVTERIASSLAGHSELVKVSEYKDYYRVGRIKILDKETENNLDFIVSEMGGEFNKDKNEWRIPKVG